MKKLIFSFAVLSLVFATSCGGDDDTTEELSCTELTANYTTAFLAYTETQNEDTCSDYKVAAQAYLDAECITGEEATAIESSLEILDCTAL